MRHHFYFGKTTCAKCRLPIGNHARVIRGIAVSFIEDLPTGKHVWHRSCWDDYYIEMMKQRKELQKNNRRWFIRLAAES